MPWIVVIVVSWAMMLASPAGWAAEPATPIGTLLPNPSAMHRKVFKLEGIAKNVAAYSGMENSTRQPLCGADFDLEDDTGMIVVLYHVRCQSGGQRAAVIGEGMRLVVDGYVDAPPTMLRSAEGKDLGARFMAQSVTPSKP